MGGYSPLQFPRRSHRLDGVAGTQGFIQRTRNACCQRPSASGNRTRRMVRAQSRAGRNVKRDTVMEAGLGGFIRALSDRNVPDVSQSADAWLSDAGSDANRQHFISVRIDLAGDAAGQPTAEFLAE